MDAELGGGDGAAGGEILGGYNLVCGDGDLDPCPNGNTAAAGVAHAPAPEQRGERTGDGQGRQAGAGELELAARNRVAVEIQEFEAGVFQTARGGWRVSIQGGAEGCENALPGEGLHGALQTDLRRGGERKAVAGGQPIQSEPGQDAPRAGRRREAQGELGRELGEGGQSGNQVAGQNALARDFDAGGRHRRGQQLERQDHRVRLLTC